MREDFRFTMDERARLTELLAAAGVRWGIETLRQLVDDRGRVPCCTIDDAPDFRMRPFSSQHQQPAPANGQLPLSHRRLRH